MTIRSPDRSRIDAVDGTRERHGPLGRQVDDERIGAVATEGRFNLDGPGSTRGTELAVGVQDAAQGPAQPRQLGLPEHLTTGQASSFEGTCLGLEQVDRDREIVFGPRGFGLDAGGVRLSEVSAEDLLEHAVDQGPLVPRVDVVRARAVLQVTDPQDPTEEVAGGTGGPVLERGRRHAALHPLTQPRGQRPRRPVHGPNSPVALALLAATPR